MGSVSRTLPPSGKPSPPGENAMVWASSVRQRPDIDGVIVGFLPPSASLSGWAKVRMIGWAGPSGLPGAGRAIAEAGCSAGNQLTRTGFDRRSQVRGAVEIRTLPLSPFATDAGSAIERTGVFRVRRTWVVP